MRSDGTWPDRDRPSAPPKTVDQIERSAKRYLVAGVSTLGVGGLTMFYYAMAGWEGGGPGWLLWLGLAGYAGVATGICLLIAAVGDFVQAGGQRHRVAVARVAEHAAAGQAPAIGLGPTSAATTTVARTFLFTGVAALVLGWAPFPWLLLGWTAGPSLLVASAIKFRRARELRQAELGRAATPK